jgi:hypothetical protein
MPVLVTAPTEVNKTKPADVPKVGACPKFILGKNNRTITIKKSSLFFIIKLLFVKEFSQCKGDVIAI